MPRTTCSTRTWGALCVVAALAASCAGTESPSTPDSGQAADLGLTDAGAVVAAPSKFDGGLSENLCADGPCPRQCIGSPNCTMPDGCPGLKECIDGIWGACYYSGTGSIPCTDCGSGGQRACTVDGPSPSCTVAPQACSCGGWSGTKQCLNHQWTVCDISANDCTTPACAARQPLARGHPQCSSDGTAVCRLSPLPLWVNPTVFCTTQCGTLGTARCDNQGDGLCRGRDVCNNCDDDLDGVVDNVPGGGPYSYWEACSGPNSECVGKKVCVNGVLSTCGTFLGSKTCTNWCGDSKSQVCDSSTGRLSDCPQRPELCNGIDDNCNGQIDEGDVCRQTGQVCQ